MSALTRSSFELLSGLLGQTYGESVNSFGNANKSPYALLKLEAAMCRLREATIFHDDEYALVFPKFQSIDIVGLGLQSARFAQPVVNAVDFEPWTSQIWYPGLEGPPSLEGWKIWYYNSWSSYTTDPQHGGEDGNYDTRKTYTYPVRYTGGGSYVRVPFWKHARYISFQNNTGKDLDYTSGSITVSMPLSELAGYQILHPVDKVPWDVRFYSYPEFIQTFKDAWADLDTPVPEAPNAGCLPTLVLHSAVITGSDITFSLEIPNWITWESEQFWHVIMYWGSSDSLALASDPTGGKLSAVPDVSATLWLRKNFFRQDILDKIGWKDTGFDGSRYLIARNRTHFSFNDGQYSNPSIPSKYALLDTKRKPIIGVDQSLVGYIPEISRGEFVTVILATKTTGTGYDNPSALPEVFVGPVVTPEFVPDDWRDCPYFPSLPPDYTALVRMAVTGAPGAATNLSANIPDNSGAIPSELRRFNNYEPPRILCEASIAWAEQVVPTHAEMPHGDGDWASIMLPALRDTLMNLRLYISENPVVTAAYSMLLPGVNMPNAFKKSMGNLKDSTQLASRIFRGLLKTPVDTIMEPDQGTLLFDSSGRKLISDLAGLPPSTELISIKVNASTVNDVRLPVANTLEVYYSPSDQCHVMTTGAGERLGQDYTLRMVLETSDENLFTKDWYITASSYFLTKEEYNRRVDSQLSTTGYFYADILNRMPQFRLHGYAGVVPDLAMGDSRTLMTRVVSPPDETRQTESQFRQNLANQGYTSEQIDAFVQAYLDNGGEFLIIDLNQYDNKFVAVRNSSICVSKYNFFDTPYWLNNTSGLFSQIADGGRTILPESALNYRADSFTIAESGLAPGDLERYGTQSTYLVDAGIDYSDQTGFEVALTSRFFAIKILPIADDASVSGFNLRLKCSLDQGESLANSSLEGIRVHLFSDASDRPLSKLASGGLIQYSKINKDVFTEQHVSLPYVMRLGVQYWLVLEQTVEPSGGRVVIDTGATTYVDSMMMYDPSPTGHWSQSSGRIWLRGYDSNTLTTSPTFEAENPDLPGWESGQDEVLSYKYHAGLVELDGTTSRVMLRLRAKLYADNTSGNLFNADEDTVKVVIQSDNSGVPSGTVVSTGVPIKQNIITSEFTNYTFDLDQTLVAGTYWVVVSTSARPLGGSIAYCKQSRPNTFICTSSTDSAFVTQGNKPWLRSYLSSPTMFAAFNRDTSNVLESLPGPNDQRTYTSLTKQSSTYKVESYWSYDFTRFAKPTSLTLYPRAAFDLVTQQWLYTQFSKKCHVMLRLLRGDKIIDKYIEIPAAPGWRGQFTNRTAESYQIFDSTPVSVDVTFDSIDLQNYDGNGLLGDYFNAKISGYFTPKYSEVYSLTITSSGGCRVYLDGALVLDTWLSPTNFPTPVSLGLLSNTTVYNLTIEYYSANETPQFLTAKWQSSTQNVDFICRTSALVPANTEIVISDAEGDMYDGIAYMAVGKTLSDIDDLYNGAPPGDHLIVRSS